MPMPTKQKVKLKLLKMPRNKPKNRQRNLRKLLNRLMQQLNIRLNWMPRRQLLKLKRRGEKQSMRRLLQMPPLVN